MSERLNRTLEEGARAALLDSKLSTYYWPFAVQYAMHVKNRLPHSAVHFKIPFELWSNKGVNFGMFRPFGCAIVAYDPETTGKFQPTGVPGRFLGYSTERKGFLVLRNDTKAVFPSRHITVIIQNEFCHTPNQSNIDEVNELFWETDPDAPSDPTDLNPPTQLYDVQPYSEVVDDSDDIPASPSSISDQEQAVVEADHGDLLEPLTPDHDPEVHPDVIGGDTHFLFLTNKELADYKQKFPTANLKRTTGFKTKPNPNGGPGRPANAYRYMINCMIQPDEVRDALTGSKGDSWRIAMRNEFNSLIQNGTWTLVKRPDGVKPVRCKWILKKKYDDGEMIYKTRLVAKGFSQRQGIDYFDTFSPVIRISSVRLLLSYAVTHNLHSHHIDVKTAFLNRELREDV